jgi:hypothetical protein
VARSRLASAHAALVRTEKPLTRLCAYQPTIPTFAQLNTNFGTPLPGFGLCSGYSERESTRERGFRDFGPSIEAVWNVSLLVVAGAEQISVGDRMLVSDRHLLCGVQPEPLETCGVHAGVDGPDILEVLGR